jgi:hypothetical protein
MTAPKGSYVFHPHRTMHGIGWWIAYALAVPLTLFISITYSRDYSTYLEIISSMDSTDLIFDAYIRGGDALGAGPELIYSLYSATHLGLLMLFFAKRRVPIYWISVYLLCFGSLHVTTQIRAGMASLVLAFLLTSTRHWVRFLTPISMSIHSSTVLFIGSGISARRPVLVAMTMVGTTAVALYFAFTTSEKLSLYALDINESQTISIAVASYIVSLITILFARLDPTYKAILLTAGAITIAVYIQFLDIKAISNRFVELSHAVSILMFGALDSPMRNRKPSFPKWLKFLLLINALLLFYVSNVSNSILNI